RPIRSSSSRQKIRVSEEKRFRFPSSTKNEQSELLSAERETSGLGKFRGIFRAEGGRKSLPTSSRKSKGKEPVQDFVQVNMGNIERKGKQEEMNRFIPLDSNCKFGIGTAVEKQGVSRETYFP
ncbi:hypothetical protein NPIL_664141, partial [Nephila pilipes]